MGVWMSGFPTIGSLAGANSLLNLFPESICPSMTWSSSPKASFVRRKECPRPVSRSRAASHVLLSAWYSSPSGVSKNLEFEASALSIGFFPPAAKQKSSEAIDHSREGWTGAFFRLLPDLTAFEPYYLPRSFPTCLGTEGSRRQGQPGRRSGVSDARVQQNAYKVPAACDLIDMPESPEYSPT